MSSPNSSSLIKKNRIHPQLTHKMCDIEEAWKYLSVGYMLVLHNNGNNSEFFCQIITILKCELRTTVIPIPQEKTFQIT